MKKLYANLPETPGVYLFKDKRGDLLYVGKAASLKKRVSSYFLRPHEARIQRLVSLVRHIDYQKTDTALEALILEAELIKKNQPPFNVLEKDDKSFLYVQITAEEFPRVLPIRGKDLKTSKLTVQFGPFTSATSVRQALTLIRRIFPFHTHLPNEVGRMKRPCFNHEIGLCPGVCAGLISKNAYGKIVRNIKLFFTGKKDRIISSLTADMQKAARSLDYEGAADLRRRLFAIQHIQDIAFIGENEVGSPDDSNFRMRVEGYDISNISGDSAVGSMVVFINGKPARSEYRKFKIKTVKGPNDVKMLEEVLLRRFRNAWELPSLILIDGGLGQVGIAQKVLRLQNLAIPILGMIKGPKRKRVDVLGAVPDGVSQKTLIRVRDEAHRFAIQYHRAMRRARMSQ
ncbi:MAG: excinuclease ABC subunit UvrC [Patescibacteria group bacterium]